MWEESKEDLKPLRTGLTTGSCATACSVACAEYLLGGQQLKSVSITLPSKPRGNVKRVIFELTGHELIAENVIRFQVIKDAGDDPDVTHGATVFVELMLLKKRQTQNAKDSHNRKIDTKSQTQSKIQNHVYFKAAEGVGTVTREGLSLAVGEPAINPVPRQMITQHLQEISEKYHYTGDFQVAIGVENGEMIAQKTMNPRLGILGGLSILGTTGVVRPFSCAAWVASIYQGIDVAKANGLNHIAASTGNSSEAAIKEHYQLSDMALIEMGDFAGAVLKHLKKAPVEKLSICGGFGKITKLANGYLNLNSRESSIDFQQLADIAKQQGANQQLQEDILSANTSIEVLSMCQKQQIDLAKSVCEQALSKAKSIVPNSVEIEVWAINRQGEFIGSAFE